MIELQQVLWLIVELQYWPDMTSIVREAATRNNVVNDLFKASKLGPIIIAVITREHSIDILW